ncbi:MAG: DUF4392 domain-containing protein [Gemmataceae bacterium]
MSIAEKLAQLLAVVQVDVGGRGLARDPHSNLFTACPNDFAAACRSLGVSPAPRLGIVTGFWIPSAELPETDGPLGAVYLARTIGSLGCEVHLISDPFCRRALEAGLAVAGVAHRTPVHTLGDPLPAFTHLLALERVGPGHTEASLRAQAVAPEILQQFLAEVPPEQRGRCRSMRGIDISAHMSDAASLFEPFPLGVVTLGIGDGGNEIGMGKIAWPVIRANIPRGGSIACRVPTHHLIVAGISNWGAYALAAGVALVRGVRPPAMWFEADLEWSILQAMVQEGPLVDGVTGRQEPTVDGVAFPAYARPLSQIREVVEG